MSNKYIAYHWPEYQEYMGEEWFREETYYDSNKDIYLIPIDRIHITSIDYKYTKIWRVNGKFIVSDTIEEVIKLYKSWATAVGKPTDIMTVIAVGDNQIYEKYGALILDIK